MCFNCRQRGTGICEFDTEPKRRGPDRQPGARQRQGSTTTAPTGRRNSRAARSIRGVDSSRDDPTTEHTDNPADEDEHPGTSPQQDAPPGHPGPPGPPPPGSFSAARDPGAIAPIPRVVPSLAPPYSDARSSGPLLPIRTAGHPGSGIDLPALHAGAPLSYAHSEAESPSKVLRPQHGAHPHHPGQGAIFVLSPPGDSAYLHDPAVQHHVQVQHARHAAPTPFVHPHPIISEPPASLPLRAVLLTPPNSVVEFRRASRDSQTSLESSVSPPSVCSSEPAFQVTNSSQFPQPDIVDPEVVPVAAGHPAYAEFGQLSLQSAHQGLVADDYLYHRLSVSAELQKADHDQNVSDIGIDIR